MSSSLELPQSVIDDLNDKAQVLFALKAQGAPSKKWAEVAVQCLKMVADDAEFLKAGDIGDSFLYRRVNGIYVFCKVRGDVDLQEDGFQGYGFYIDSPPPTFAQMVYPT